MNLPNRKVEFKDVVEGDMPLILGFTGPSNSGKTFSALRVATGIQSVVGGDIFGMDTESKRMAHYKKYFKFKHYDFTPPHGPLDYVVGIEAGVKAGAKIILIDSMTHEHSGDGGVLDQIEAFLQAKAGDDFSARQRFNMIAQVKPKAQRKYLNRRIVSEWGKVIFLLCYRAVDKIKPPRRGSGDKEMINMGWQPDTTSPLVYDMTARFLLTPGCEGRPMLAPETEAEKLMVKTARQFDGWFKPGFQLDEDLGRKFALWATGKDASATAPKPATSQPPQAAPAPPQAVAQVPLSALAVKIETAFNSAKTEAYLNEKMEKFNEVKGELTIEERKHLLGVRDKALEEILKQGKLA